MNNRIKFAYYFKGWEFDPETKDLVKGKGQKIIPEHYVPEMKGWLFCPECFVNLYRSPKDKAQSENGRKAYFAHSKGIESECGLRSKRAEGRKYLNEEEALKAIQNEELVVISDFLDKPPGITKNFDENIHRYFFMPRGQYAVQLQDLLVNIENVKKTDDFPRLYYGKITKSFNAGKKPTSIRMTQLRYNGADSEFADFYFKLQDKDQQDKGMTCSNRFTQPVKG